MSLRKLTHIVCQKLRILSINQSSFTRIQVEMESGCEVFICLYYAYKLCWVRRTQTTTHLVKFNKNYKISLQLIYACNLYYIHIQFKLVLEIENLY